MAANPRRRTIRLPSPDLANHALPMVRQAKRSWYRVHPTHHSALYFSLLTTHRFSHPNCPEKILYMAIDAETCLWERFGDQLFDQELALPKTVWESFSISRLEAPFMDLCDLANLGTRAKLRVDLTALMNEDLSVPQEWGLAIQLHPSNVAGIKYKSRFSSSACVALFERNGIAAQIKAEELGPLTLQPEALAWLEKRQVSLV